MRNHSPIDRLLTLAVVAALTVAFPHATARADVGVAIDVAGALSLIHI